MGLSRPRPVRRPNCDRKSPQASRATVVTAYLAENSTRSFEFLIGEAQAQRFEDHKHLGAKTAFVDAGRGGTTRGWPALGGHSSPTLHALGLLHC
jgi:hypothetical protein